jgi:hypothetical protein
MRNGLIDEPPLRTAEIVIGGGGLRPENPGGSGARADD